MGVLNLNISPFKFNGFCSVKGVSVALQKSFWMMVLGSSMALFHCKQLCSIYYTWLFTKHMRKLENVFIGNSQAPRRSYTLQSSGNKLTAPRQFLPLSYSYRLTDSK